MPTFNFLAVILVFLFHGSWSKDPEKPITAKQSLVNVDEGKFAEMVWTVAKSYKSKSLKSVYITIGENTVASGVELTELTIKGKGKTDYGGRLGISSTDEGDVKLFIRNAQPSDSNTFYIYVTYINGEKPEASSIKLEVKGKSSNSILGSGSTTESIAKIVGAVVGGIFLLIILIILCVYCVRRRSLDRTDDEDTDDEDEDIESTPMSKYSKTRDEATVRMVPAQNEYEPPRPIRAAPGPPPKPPHAAPKPTAAARVPPPTAAPRPAPTAAPRPSAPPPIAKKPLIPPKPQL